MKKTVLKRISTKKQNYIYETINVFLSPLFLIKKSKKKNKNYIDHDNLKWVSSKLNKLLNKLYDKLYDK